MTVPIDDILRMLRNYPSGATTRELAGRLGMTPDSLGPRLSKAWMYGKIDRDVIRRTGPPPGRSCFMLWKHWSEKK
jgi:hypothetical protein